MQKSGSVRWLIVLPICCSGRCEHLALRISDDAHDTGAAYPVFLGNIGQRHSREAIADERIAVNVERRTPEAASLDLGAAHSCTDSFSLKPGAEVQVTIEADADATKPKNEPDEKRKK
jgi:hypothetical protein